MEQVLIKKIPNNCGNYMTQRLENKHWIIEAYKSYEEAVTTMFFKGYTKEYQDLEKSIILIKE